MADEKENQEIELTQEVRISLPEISATHSQVSNSLIGEILDERFLIEKELFEDGTNKENTDLVYLAKDRKLLDKKVIVKIPKTAAPENEDVIRKFQHEKETLAKLDHPNIVRLIYSGTLSDGKPFLVTDYIPGHSLRRILNNREKLKFDFIAHITLSVAEALSAAHSRKILHRNIKPENITLTPQEDDFDYVRLIDFGTVLQKQSSQIIDDTGAPYYAAPEQIYGRLEQTPAADIYSLAIIIFEMLTNENPFQANSIVELFYVEKEGVRIKPRSLRNDIPVKAEKILLSALEFKAQKRPQDARIFGCNLVSALLDKPDYPKNADRQIIKTTESSVKNDKNHISYPVRIHPPERRHIKTFLWFVAVLFITTMISIPIGFAFFFNVNKSSKSKTIESKTAETMPVIIQPAKKKFPKELSYYLTVLKMRGGKALEKPFKSAGREIFVNGYKFKINFQSNTAGFIYFFSEHKNEQEKTVYQIIYPTPKIDNGAAQLEAKQPVETAEITFSENSGTEIVWLIWTAAKYDELESIKQLAFDAQGKINDKKNVEKLTDFLQKSKDENVETNKDTVNQQTIIRANGDKIIHRIGLQHK